MTEKTEDKTHYGKAYSGEVFADDLVTYDMVQSLLNPLVKKSLFDYIIVLLLLANCGVYYYLSKQFPHLVIPVFVASYFFWRVAYNLGIGILLYNQSNYNSLTNFCKKHALFNYSDKPSSLVQRFIELNFEIKYGETYRVKNYPVDFNTWLLFRNFVDLILMQDFVNYIILFVACFVEKKPYIMDGEAPLLFYARWVFGILFIVFNLVVKIDAHNVIKDFAWYWGDFFYLKINNDELVFDGIFELFPHPMYSIGYIGYYGFALLSRSYLVLVVSVVAHLFQFLFLHYVEDPHIHKIYGGGSNHIDELTAGHETKIPPMVFLKNFSFLRPADYFVFLINAGIFALFNSGYLEWSPKVNFALFTVCLAAKLISSTGTSLVLYLQSSTKYFTKMYLKRDLDFVDAFNSWCVLYNFQMLVNVNLLVCLFVREFVALYNVHLVSVATVILLFQTKLFFFKLFVGTFLLFLNYICEVSIVSSIGLHSWFYGDFWLPNWKQKQLSRTGIYKYLNNPERVLGICGVWGLSVICFDLSYLFILAMVWSLCKIVFISCVETPHMVKVYGEQVNYDSGFSKTFKKILPKGLRERSPSAPKNKDKKRASSPSVSVLSAHSFSDTHSLELCNTSVVQCDSTDAFTGKNNDKLTLAIGQPIKFRFRAPKESSKDWVGLYKVVNTFTSTKTTLSGSNNHWIAIHPESYNNRVFGHEHSSGYDERDDEIEGCLEFNNELLYWEPGVYELRYHSGEGHDVAVVSRSFELVFEKVVLPKNKEDTAQFEEQLFDLFVKNNYLNFEFFDGKDTKSFAIQSLESDYVDLILEYVGKYANAILASEDLKTNLRLKSLNSYNVEEFKKRKLNEILGRLGSVIKNSIEHEASGTMTTIDVEFSREILIQDRILRTLFERVVRVQKILDEIAN